MGRRRSDPNGILAVASYMFIDRYKRRTRKKISGVHYNKYMTLLNRTLLEEGISIGLPHCWYRWGDEVVRYHMPQQITWNHEDSMYTTVDWSGAPPVYDPEDELVQRISGYVDEFMERYSTPEKYELMKDDVYAEAPYDFQREYRKLREISQILKKRGFPDQNKNVVRPLFEDAMGLFPEKEFKTIIREKEAFEELFSLALDKGLSTTDLNTIAEDFWFFFCYFLRLDKKCHENVPQTTIKIWRDALPDETRRYRSNIEDAFYNLLDDTDEKTPIMLELLARRKKRKEQEEAALSYLDGIDLTNFEETIRSMRRGLD